MKLKNIILTSTILGVSTLFGSVNPALAANSSTNGIVVANFEQIVQNSKLFKDSLQEFHAKYDARAKEIQDTGAKLEKQQQTLTALKTKLDSDLKSGKLSGAALRARETDLNKQVQDFQTKAQKYQQDSTAFQREVQQYQAQQLQMITSKVKAVIENYAAKNGYTLVLDSKVGIYFKPSLDKTAEFSKVVE